jgi:glutamyl-tRNA synthetase/glutamyl-Q tRNA(Asp) synthetase
VTRFAPAPTGWLHLGHAVNAVFVWGLARRGGGRVALRIENHDRGRSRPEFEAGILDDLEWLGLAPDVTPVVRQSARTDAYEAALARLGAYACVCSRRDIAELAPGALTESRYPGTCRALQIPADATRARRVSMEPGAERFDDVAHGSQSQDPSHQCGDVLVRDRNGNWTYQFAVVVDDIAQDINVVIRGADLLLSTGRQIRLARLLGRATPPVFLHHPLILRADGSKLSKSDGATGLRDLRTSGWAPERVLGDAAHLGGLQPSARSINASDLANLF